MEAFTIRDLSFAYPEQRKDTLSHLSFSIPQGQFVTLCGPSGCGKSTLLRQLKTVLAPAGYRRGAIFFEGTPLDEVDQRTQSARIGFVQQSPENQIVTDKVWHELAFGLESLGFDTPTIRSRVAEMASFFGIQTWFYKNVTELSGGQKQLLNLASIMAMQPSVLILDEPTSQLDPIAASDFLATIGKVNRELGTTILLTEHRLEEAFPLSDRVLVMDKGRLIADGTPSEVGERLRGSGHAMFLAMPTAMRVWASVEDDSPCPITVRDGRDWLAEFADKHSLGELPEEITPSHSDEETAIILEDVWFKYEKDLPDVVKGVSLTVKKGEFLALLGGNGTGKTTTLSIVGGLLTPYRGEVKLNGRVGTLPQNPQTLFVKKTVREDLFEIFKGLKVDKAIQENRVARAVQLCRLEELLDRHPYDLSGGEQQRAALAKVLLLDPEILLMDEPTKGLDAEFKQVFAVILKTLLRRGVTVFMVSHDVEFCAEFADRCALFFDGNIVSQGRPRSFFSGNSFYTTSSNRMARTLLPEAVTPRDIMAACGGTLPPEPELPEETPPLPEPAEDSANAKPKKLPLWRILLAAVSGLGAIGLFIYTVSHQDLSALITENGLTAAAWQDIPLYLLLVACMLICAFSLSRKAPEPVRAQTPKEKRQLSKRTIAAAISILLLIPLTIFIGAYYLGGRKYYLIAILILLETMLPFFLVFEGRKPQARELVVIAVLCAIGVVGRGAFFMLPSFKPVLALVIISGVAFGGETGFLVGAMTMVASNVLFGQGPWTPFQMFSAGIIGFLAGVLFRKGLLHRTRISLCIFGAIATVVIYGGIMNPAAALIYANTLDWKLLLSYYVSGIPVDLIHATATVLFLWLAAEPMLEKLDRIKVKYNLIS